MTRSDAITDYAALLARIEHLPDALSVPALILVREGLLDCLHVASIGASEDRAGWCVTCVRPRSASSAEERCQEVEALAAAACTLTVALGT
jgi:hypothetical protein